MTVAYYLAEYQLDAPALVAALLHDVAEDTRVTIGEIETQFGAEVAQLVDGLTKFEQVSEGAAARQLSKAEIESKTLHKLLGMMARDVRIGIIKLFDRRHNMRTLKAKNRQSQERKAKETLAVYTPLANRLGICSLNQNWKPFVSISYILWLTSELSNSYVRFAKNSPPCLKAYARKSPMPWRKLGYRS